MSDDRAGRSGKIIVIGMGVAMVFAYFLMATQGQIFSASMWRQIWLPVLIGLILGVGGLITAISLANRLEASTKLRKVVTAFFLTLLLMMTLVVFRMSGIGI